MFAAMTNLMGTFKHGKRVQPDGETWLVLDVLARDRTAMFQELADEAFDDRLKKYHVESVGVHRRRRRPRMAIPGILPPSNRPREVQQNSCAAAVQGRAKR